MDLSKLSETNLLCLEQFWHWADTTGRAKVYRFDIAGDRLERLVAVDTLKFASATHLGLSNLITDFLSVSTESLNFFINYSEPADWTARHPDLYACYRMFKLLWLCEDIRSNGVQAPMQLIQHGRGYRTHPGSDKKFVLTLLEPRRSIPMFYIWYPELDPAPWIWTTPHTEVTSPEDFCDLFAKVQHPTFQFKYEEILLGESAPVCSDPHLMPWAQGAHYACVKYGKIKPRFSLRLPTISYTDAVHRQGLHADIKHIMSQAHQTDPDVFRMANHRFIQHQGIWMLDRFLNFPTSLVDTDWRWRADQAVYFDNQQPCISDNRQGM